MKITRGKIHKPYFMVLYGREKIGKTTFAAGAKNVIITGPEEGSNNLDVARTDPVKSFKEMMANIRWLREEKHDFKTVAIDSITKLEPMVWEEVCKLDGSSSISEAQKGFGKGYLKANQYWQEMIESLKNLKNEREMNIIAIAHAVSKNFNDPLLFQPYNRYLLQMNDQAASLWTREVDCLAFASIETYLKEGDSTKLNRAFSENKRVLNFAPSTAFEAGNRLGLPDKLELSYSAFEAAIGSNEKSIDDFKKELLEKANTLKDEKTKEAAIKYILNAKTREDLQATRKRLDQIA